jgi:hypothetical protein
MATTTTTAANTTGTPTPQNGFVPNQVLTLAQCNQWLWSTFESDCRDMKRAGAHPSLEMRHWANAAQPHDVVVWQLRDWAGDGRLTMTYADMNHAPLALSTVTPQQLARQAVDFWVAAQQIFDLLNMRRGYMMDHEGQDLPNAQALVNMAAASDGDTCSVWGKGDQIPDYTYAEEYFSQEGLDNLHGAYPQ